MHWVFNCDPQPNNFENYVNSFPLFSQLSLAGFEKREGQCPIAIPADNDADRERSLGFLSSNATACWAGGREQGGTQVGTMKEIVCDKKSLIYIIKWAFSKFGSQQEDSYFLGLNQSSSDQYWNCILQNFKQSTIFCTKWPKMNITCQKRAAAPISQQLTLK